MTKINTEKKIRKIEIALDILASHESHCQLCPRECKANRKKGEKGFCHSSVNASVSHALLHYGEEPVLSKISNTKTKETIGQKRGSGTIFFSGCNLKCLFCQNYQISWMNQGKEIDEEGLAEMMLDLQVQGAVNINLVSPTHVILPILKALRIAYTEGLNLPLVYNSNSYEKIQILRNLEGIVDVYLPDLKYRSPSLAEMLSQSPDYFQWASRAITEMYCQQPVLKLNQANIAERGLIVRHLILPGQTDDSLQILHWMEKNLSPGNGLSLMSQYYPCYKAPPDFQRTLEPEEFRSILQFVEKSGFDRVFAQPEPFSPGENLIPDFRKKKPFDWD